jgi:hypothetical protein
MEAAMAENPPGAEEEEETDSNSEDGMSVHKTEAEDAEKSVGSHSLPCKKTLTAWAKSKFQQWLAQSESSSEPSGTWTWEHKKSRFSAQQVIAWFKFKDKKYLESTEPSERLGNHDSTAIDRQLFGCSKMFHQDPEFISIFRKPLAKVARKTGEKLKRYDNQCMFLPNSSDKIVAYPSSGHHQP